MLLSATLDGDVDRLVRTHLREPVLHELDAAAGSVTTMDHHVMLVGGFRDKVAAVTALIEANPRSIVFTRTREGATELRDAFAEGGIEAVDLHGNLSQRVRERNLHKFSSGKAQVVVATDVAARGIHVDNVGLVVHFDVPNDPKAYLHRSGRTARAGESGAVVTITTPRQVDEVVRLQSRAGVESRHHDVRTAPRPMTAEALAGAGEAAPAARRGGSSSGRPREGGRSSGYQGSRSSGYQGSRASERPARGARSYERDERPARGYDRDERPARAGRQDRPERPARAERSDRPQRPAPEQRDRRPSRPARPQRDDRPQRFERDERPQRETRSARGPEREERRPAAKRPLRASGKKARWTSADKKQRSR